MDGEVDGKYIQVHIDRFSLLGGDVYMQGIQYDDHKYAPHSQVLGEASTVRKSFSKIFNPPSIEPSR
ncbi:hypothetical protein D770_05245 [Flammeovirgaceae bacterium 311]|nr:hypothetical protein D770_05245 [Flammeovirgaceae bacterium 311]